MRKQVIRTAPRKFKVGTYLTVKGLRLKAQGATKAELAKYIKNRYVTNPFSVPFIKFVDVERNGLAKIKIVTHNDAFVGDGKLRVPITKMHQARIHASQKSN